MTNIQKITGALMLGIIIGALATLVYGAYSVPSNQELQNQEIAAYFAHETAALVSPHSVRERMDRGDDTFILVDVRAEEDYEREHIIGAINIDTSKPLADTLNAFKLLPQEKQIIIYCYSAACMNGRKAGNFLAENGVYVQEMTIGWNEWRYGWEMWNYDTEWDDHRVDDYVISGNEPGTPKKIEEGSHGCPVGGSLSC